MLHIFKTLHTAELRFLIFYFKAILFFEAIWFLYFKREVLAYRIRSLLCHKLWEYPEKKKFVIRLPKLRLHVWVSVDRREINNYE